MTPDDDNESVLYEVNLDADAAIEGPFDTWLRDHIADLLQLDGFRSAEILEDRTAPPGRVRRIVQYRLRDQAALDAYLRDHAPVMRTQGVAKFGDRYSTERRVLAHREEFVRGRVSTENCLNCGEVLTGQHCSHCGQRARVRVLSLWGLLRDVLGDALNWDSRLWRTFRPLAFSPGLLTQEFLRGRRAHYTPPFRMYLILSVAFFLSTTLGADPGADLHLDLDGNGANLQYKVDETPPAAGSTTTTQKSKPAQPGANSSTPAAPAPKLAPDRQRIVDAIVSRLPAKDQARARTEMEREFAAMTPEQVSTVDRVVANPCSPDNLKIDIGPFGDKYAPRLRQACNKIVTDSKGFGRALYDNIPKMMFIFLPLIAGVMYVLYLGSGRYYVEHLLFFVHFHAFFFLGGIAVVLLERAGGVLGTYKIGGLLESLGKILITVLMIYVPIYLYRAMRRVYGQGRIVTLLKYSILVVGYLFFLTLTGVGLLFYTALTL
ncbi:MAG TPA: DUF4286 family protein [Steroidobacteraceae bacterium]